MENNNNPGIRLQAYLAQCGIASRRACEDYITAGRVKINGEVKTELGVRVFSGDAVLFDDKPVLPEAQKHYVMLNKPTGYVCSMSDPQGRSLAVDLIKPYYEERLYNVGRLDYFSSGLILFTNDGAFTKKVGHPSSGLEKEYYVVCSLPIPDSVLYDFCEGVDIEGEKYKAVKVSRIDNYSATVTLVEGKNREIRKVFAHYDLYPKILRRIRFGSLLLDDLKEGQSRSLTEKEVSDLLQLSKG